MITPGQFNFEVRAGATFRQLFYFTAAGEIMDMTAINAVEFVVYDENGTVVFDVTDSSTGDSHINIEVTAGALEILIDAAETLAAPAGCYQYRLTLFFTNDDVDDYLIGGFSLG